MPTIDVTNAVEPAAMWERGPLTVKVFFEKNDEGDEFLSIYLLHAEEPRMHRLLFRPPEVDVEAWPTVARMFAERLGLLVLAMIDVCKHWPTDAEVDALEIAGIEYTQHCDRNLKS
jgi:hypothetical protein